MRPLEATLISQWWAESVDHFDSDVEGLVSYIKEYFRVYAGRGLPEPVCTSLVMRMRSTGGKGSTKEIEAELKKAKDKASAAEESVKTMKNRMKDLEDAVKKVSGAGKEKMRSASTAAATISRATATSRIAARVRSSRAAPRRAEALRARVRRRTPQARRRRNDPLSSAPDGGGLGATSRRCL